MDKYAARTRDISIHAPRKGSDGTSLMLARPLWYFYPRSPRGERPKAWQRRSASSCNFYPRSPRGERRCSLVADVIGIPFLSTLPARGATAACKKLERVQPISIHAPREGSDVPTTLPARGATGHSAPDVAPAAFLSTLPARGATLLITDIAFPPVEFLSTLPARGATSAPPKRGNSKSYFYPRSPRGERRRSRRWRGSKAKFLSTLPARGATLVLPDVKFLRAKFLSTLPARGATTGSRRKEASK